MIHSNIKAIQQNHLKLLKPFYISISLGRKNTTYPTYDQEQIKVSALTN